MGQAEQRCGREYSKGARVVAGHGETTGEVMAELGEIGDETREGRGGEVWHT